MARICYVVTIPETIKAFFIPQLKCLSERGHGVTVVCSPDDCLQEELGEGIVFHPIHIPRGVSVSGMIGAFFELKSFFKRNKFDLIQYSTPNAALCASLAAKKAKCGIRNYHMMGFRYIGASGLFRKILKALEKTTCIASTDIECVSYSNLNFGIAEGVIPSEKAVVVWNGSTGGVDVKRFSINKRSEYRTAVRRELGLPLEAFVYGFVGRITADKGVNELLHAFLGLNNDSKLLMIGDMENEQSIDRDLLEAAKESQEVYFHSSVKDIERYYAAMDALVLPSYREGFGNVIIEAGALGTPAIVSDIPGPTDAIEAGKTALIVPVKDSTALRQAMQHMRSIDYKAMGVAAAEFVAGHFDAETLCVKIAERKERLLEKKQADSSIKQ